jgi:yecA family protein
LTELTSLIFDDFCELLLPLGALNSPSELHGLLCGKLCGGATLSPEQWQQAAWELLDVVGDPDPDTQQQVSALYKVTQAQLSSGDYDLQPFLPDDDTDMEQRAQALSQWCHGFLSGFGSAGIDPSKEFSSDQADSLRDLAAIVQVGVDDEHEEDADRQEANYFELVEYVRVLAMNFYEDHMQGLESKAAADNFSTDTPPPQNLH